MTIFTKPIRHNFNKNKMDKFTNALLKDLQEDLNLIKKRNRSNETVKYNLKKLIGNIWFTINLID